MSEGSYIADRIRANCHEDGDCLLWLGKVNKAGAPVAGTSIRRQYWEATRGPIPQGKLPHPTCGRRGCVEHLELTTLSAVMKEVIARPDVLARWKVASNHRPKKLDMETARSIRVCGLPQRETAARFGVAQSLVSQIKNNIRWRESARANPFSSLMRYARKVLMTQFDNTNRGVLFKNDRKTKDTQPSHTGSLNVDGVEFFLDAWVKESQNGSKFFSVSVKRKDKQSGPQSPAPAPRAPAPAPRASSGFEDMSDDIPF